MRAESARAKMAGGDGGAPPSSPPPPPAHCQFSPVLISLFSFFSPFFLLDRIWRRLPRHRHHHHGHHHYQPNQRLQSDGDSDRAVRHTVHSLVPLLLSLSWLMTGR